MKPDGDQSSQAPTDKRPDHRKEHRHWPVPERDKSASPHWNGKTMHHPAFRVGELKRGK